MDENNLNNNEYAEEQTSAPQEENTPQIKAWNNSPYAGGYGSPTQDNGMGIASMVLGIISVLGVAMCCIPFTLSLPFICGIPGIVLGALGMKRCPKRGYAIAGLTMSIASLALTVILLIGVIAMIATGNVDLNEINNMYI